MTSTWTAMFARSLSIALLVVACSKADRGPTCEQVTDHLLELMNGESDAMVGKAVLGKVGASRERSQKAADHVGVVLRQARGTESGQRLG